MVFVRLERVEKKRYQFERIYLYNFDEDEEVDVIKKKWGDTKTLKQYFRWLLDYRKRIPHESINESLLYEKTLMMDSSWDRNVRLEIMEGLERGLNIIEWCENVVIKHKPMLLERRQIKWSTSPYDYLFPLPRKQSRSCSKYHGRNEWILPDEYIENKMIEKFPWIGFDGDEE